MNKKDIRKLYRTKRNELDTIIREKCEDLMLIHFQSLKLTIPDMIMTYSPMMSRNEYDPILIEEYCYFKNPNATLMYPVADTKNHTLKAFAVKEDTLFDLNEYEIEEPIDGLETPPENIDMMIVPLLAFDDKGYRVGYGKGYYDKLIRLCRPDMIKIGFSFFESTEIEGIHDLDEKLDFCITPERIYQF